MRSLRIVALVMGFALIPLPLAHAALAAAASSLFEALPFLLAAALPARGAHARRFAQLAGCGCTVARAARSLPAALLGALVLGAPIAAARFALAWLLPAPHRAGGEAPGEAADPLGALCAYLPYALAGGAVVALLPTLAGTAASVPAPCALLAGALLAFVASPCAFGAVTLGGALLHLSPALGAGWLAVAGLCDLRALRSHRAQLKPMGRLAASAILAALAVVIVRHGAMLINPRLLPLMMLAAAATAWTLPARPMTRAGITCAALMLIAALFAHAPAEVAPANATTLPSAFAGQAFAMVGQIAHTRAGTFITRQAIACCRADAAPISVRIITSAPFATATWVQASGTLALHDGALVLTRAQIRTVAPPADPYVYR